MFEGKTNLPQNPIPPTGVPDKAPATKPVDSLAALRSSDEDMAELLKRAKVPLAQKIALIVVTVVVLGLIIGIGLWVYLTLKPLSNATRSTGTTNTQTSNGNANTNFVPLSQLDTDQDGLRDIDERKYGSNAEVADTDGDGYLDGDEVKNGYDPIGPGRLNQ